MKVKDFINQLQRYNNPDDDIIVAYWSKDEVEGWYDMEHNPDMKSTSLPDDQWKQLVERFDNHDFQQVCDDIDDTLNEIQEESDDESR